MSGAASETTADIRAYEIVASVAHIGGVEEAQIQINCSAANDRLPSTPENEAQIDAIWRERIKSNPSLFDGTKFRFAGVRQGTRVVVDLGITSYKYFLGTNCKANWHELDPMNLASPLGNAAIVETRDNKVVLLKRSQNVGECPDTIVCPGGHPEPEMVGIKTMKEWGGMSERMKELPSTDWNQQICHELFDAMVREVVEETGIPRSKLGTAKCIGFTERIVNKRPDIIFHIPCLISASEVHKLYAQGPQHEFESTELITIDRDDFIKRVLDENSINMPGCHRGGVDLYRNYIAYQDGAK